MENELMHKRTSNKIPVKTLCFCPFCKFQNYKRREITKHLRTNHTEEEGLKLLESMMEEKSKL